MIIHGLHYHISMKRLAAGELARQSRRPECDPRIGYDKEEESKRLVKEAEEMADHAKGNEEVMEAANKLLHYMSVSKHKSRYRSLFITDVESAINWLQRENGDREPERNFQALQPEPPSGQAVS